MARVNSLDEDSILALFEAKREEDNAAFGSKGAVETAVASVAAQGVLVAQHESEINAAQASILSLASAQIIQCTSTSRPVNPAVNQRIRETDTGAVGYWNGGHWMMTDEHEQSYSPVLTSDGGTVTLGAGATRNGRFRRSGTECHFFGTIFTGTTGFSGGTEALRISLPFASASASPTRFGTSMINARSNDHLATSRVDPGQLYLRLLAEYLDTAANPNRVIAAYVQNTNSAATPGTGIPKMAGVHTFDAGAPGYLNWDITYEADYAIAGP